MKPTIMKLSSVFALVSALFLFSCKKSFLERNPFDSLNSDIALSTESGLEAALNGAYASLRSVSLFGRDLPVIGDLHADNTYVEKKNAGRYLLWYNYSVSQSDGNASGMWTVAYTGILRANRIIDADVTGANVASIKAQAYAIRGLLYFELVNMFAKPYSEDPGSWGVPIITHYDPYNLPSRNSVQEVYTQIISDLQAGYADAPAYSISTRLSKYAVGALLAKAYLYMGDYSNALTTAQTVINSGPFTLVPAGSYVNFWNNSADRTDAVETLFEVNADVVDNNGFDDLGAIYVNGYQDIYASSQVYDLYSATDVRRNVLIPGNTKSGSPAYIVNKYPNAQSDDRDNLKVIRLSEVYLIAAEAAYRTNDEATALDYLNNLVAQRDPNLTYSSSGTQLLDDIVNERRKELAFEGDRLFDLNRLKWPINRDPNPGAIPAGPNDVFLNIAYPDDFRIAPIPEAELLANPNIAGQQNPGY